MRRFFDGIASFLQTPFGVLFITLAVFHGILFGLGLDYTNVFVLAAAGFILIVDIVAANFILDRLVYFFSQFILPVQTDEDSRRSMPGLALSTVNADRPFSSRTDG